MIMTLIGDSSEADRVVEKLVQETEELESVEIHDSECTDNTLQMLIHSVNVKKVRLCGGNITGVCQIPPSGSCSSAIMILNLSGRLLESFKQWNSKHTQQTQRNTQAS